MANAETEPSVTLDVQGGVATLTLSRPDRLNAMSAEMDRQLRAAFARAIAEPACRVIVITGAGRGFCAGADREPGAAAQAQPQSQSQDWAAVPERMADFRFGYLLHSPKPVVAALNGAAIGVGLVLACWCDIRLACDDARLAFPYARLGLVAEYGIAQRLPALIGAGRARELLLSGRTFSGADALDMGLVSRTSAAADFAGMVRDYVAELAQACSARSQSVIRRQLDQAADQPLLATLQQAGEELAAARTSSDYAEGLAARRERRAPRFTGQTGE